MRKMKTEHNGAKNGGGHWGRRVVAKYLSRKARRQADKAAIVVEKCHGCQAPGATYEFDGYLYCNEGCASCYFAAAYISKDERETW